MISPLRIINAFLNKQAYDFSSVQCDMPGELSEEIIAWGKQNIPENELAADGREKDIHVTVKYGLHTHDPYGVREILAGFGPIEITLGKISIFENKEADVVKLSVDSKGLHELNSFIADNFEHTDTHPDYIPHITVAYVKPGMGKKYQGRDDFAGRKLKMISAFFCGNDNRKTVLPLVKT